MNRNIYKLCLIFVLLLMCHVWIFQTEVFAAPTGTEQTEIQLTAEEQAYCERAGEITIGCPVDNCPVLYQDEKTGKIRGITIDILDMVSEETGLAFRYQPLPSGNITYEDLQELEIDMMAGVEYNEMNMHATGISMTVPYMHAEKVFVCKKGELFQPDNKMVVAVASGSQTIESVIQQQYPMFDVIFCDSTEEALNTLLSGKADAVLQNQYTIERILCKPVYEDLQVVATASIGDSQCLACLVPISGDKKNVMSEDTTLLLSIMNKGIAALDQDQIAFLIIKETAEHAYQFTLWDMLYRYRFLIAMLFVSLLLIVFLLGKNHALRLKHAEQLAAQKRAEELAEINERMKEQQLLLLDSLKHAEEGNRTKTTFLFNMSHDIRTPMNAILGFTEIARQSIGDTERLTDCIVKIQAAGNHLLHLIDNILDMAKIENGNVTLKEDGCNLEECIQKTRNILQTQIDKKHLEFHTDMSTVNDKWVYCDSIRIHQILFNLLDNAVKFNKPDGSVWVTVTQHTCNIKEYAIYEIRVKDTGIGMNQEFLDHIYEPFERERTSTMSQTQGVGLGMSITKNLVDLMDGTIKVFSEPDKGTEFVLQFTFKLKEQEGTEQQSPMQIESTDTFSGKRLLLVEDNELNMEIAQELLCEMGFSVETAKNGQIAVDMVQNSAAGYYDAVLMDIQMPLMDGYQATQAIRSMERKDLAEIPIIALTANAFDEDKKKALASGMNAHIGKPLDVGVLYETLDNILNKR